MSELGHDAKGWFQPAHSGICRAGFIQPVVKIENVEDREKLPRVSPTHGQEDELNR